MYYLAPQHRHAPDKSNDPDKGNAPDSSHLVLAERQAPTRKPGEVLIQVRAAGINRADMLQLDGKYPPPPGASDIIGLEVAGFVLDCDDDCRFEPGDRVMALLSGGGYATRVCVDEGSVLPLPASMDFVQGAAIAEAFLTAYQALFTIGQLESGQKVLIHAGASGVGTAAIQLASLAGARVFTTAGSDTKLLTLQSLGADVLINYKTQNFRDEVRLHTDKQGVDLIIDFVGGGYLADNVDCCGLDATIVSLAMLGGRFGEKLDFAKLLGKRITLTGSTLRNRSHRYKRQLVKDFSSRFLSAFDTGELAAVVDSCYQPAEIAQAYDKMMANSNIGKMIINFSDLC